jgi:hypothetical protein
MSHNKECTKCKKSVNKDRFYSSSGNRDGLSSWCKDCHNKVNRANMVKYKDLNKNKVLKGERECIKCYEIKPVSEFIKKPATLSGIRGECKKCRYADISKDGQKLKKEVIDHYGGKCKCTPCSVEELDFLTIDHINNDGAKHRKEIGSNLYRWLKKNNYPEGFQVLCCNCNYSKYLNGGACIHVINESIIKIG